MRAHCGYPAPPITYRHRAGSPLTAGARCGVDGSAHWHRWCDHQQDAWGINGQLREVRSLHPPGMLGNEVLSGNATCSTWMYADARLLAAATRARYVGSSSSAPYC